LDTCNKPEEVPSSSPDLLDVISDEEQGAQTQQKLNKSDEKLLKQAYQVMNMLKNRIYELSNENKELRLRLNQNDNKEERLKSEIDVKSRVMEVATSLEKEVDLLSVMQKNCKDILLIRSILTTNQVTT